MRELAFAGTELYRLLLRDGSMFSLWELRRHLQFPSLQPQWCGILRWTLTQFGRYVHVETRVFDSRCGCVDRKRLHQCGCVASHPQHVFDPRNTLIRPQWSSSGGHCGQGHSTVLEPPQRNMRNLGGTALLEMFVFCEERLSGRCADPCRFARLGCSVNETCLARCRGDIVSPQ